MINPILTFFQPSYEPYWDYDGSINSNQKMLWFVSPSYNSIALLLLTPQGTIQDAFSFRTKWGINDGI